MEKEQKIEFKNHTEYLDAYHKYQQHEAVVKNYLKEIEKNSDFLSSLDVSE